MLLLPNSRRGRLEDARSPRAVRARSPRMAEPFSWKSEGVEKLAALSSRWAECDAAKGEVGMARSANVQGAKLH